MQWIDAFTRKNYADIIADSLIYCQAVKELKVHAWCLKSNDIHLILLVEENHSLSNANRDFKKFTSVKILNEMEVNPIESRKNWVL